MKADVLLDLFVQMKPRCDNLEEAASIMGVSFSCLEKGLERARARGDQRGDYAPLHIRPIKDRSLENNPLLKAWAALPSPKPTYAEAAKQIGCTHAALSSMLYRARKEGLDEGSSYHKIDVEALLEDWDILHEGGASIEDAAGRLGVHVVTLRKYIDLREAS